MLTELFGQVVSSNVDPVNSLDSLDSVDSLKSLDTLDSLDSALLNSFLALSNLTQSVLIVVMMI
jgi:hypothetical protein